MREVCPENQQFQIAAQFFTFHSSRSIASESIAFLPVTPSKSRQDAPVLVLVNLERNPTHLPDIVPCQADEMLLRFAQSHECSDAKRDHRKPDGLPTRRWTSCP
jgi:hypothetical protein